MNPAGYITRTLERDRIAVRCVHRKNKFILDPEPGQPVCAVKAGTELRRLEYNETVETPEGELLPAFGQYWVTAGTIDPYHLILDIF